MVEQLRPRIQAIADELLDRVETQGAMDLVDDYAFPLPITVIAELLGIPVEDQDRFRDWSNSSCCLRSPRSCRSSSCVTRTSSSRTWTSSSRSVAPNPTEDLVSALVQAEEQGDHLSENELYSMVVLLIVAGHETTVSLITNAVLTLLTHPEELAALRTDPSLIPAAVEELLRYDSPVERAITRWAADGRRARRRDDPPRRARDRRHRLARTATRRGSPTPTRSTSRREDVKHLGFGRGRTSASARPSRASRPRSRSHAASNGSRACGSRSRRSDLYWRPIPLFRSLASLPVAWDSSDRSERRAAPRSQS